MSAPALGLGLALGLALAFGLTRLEMFQTRWAAALTLLGIVAFYPAFAHFHGQWQIFAFHSLVALAFASLCLAGGRNWALILGLGILAHGAFDAFMHFSARLSAFSVGPNWWPEFCAIVDIPVGLALIFSSRKSSHA